MISIIVGIYNVSHFLRKKQMGCIFCQTFQDWELILVDDGSTDDSGALCDEFARLDSRIKVVHKENGGLGNARNAGLDVATGEYIWFYDVDDEARPNLLEYGVGEMERGNLDMLQFSFHAITPYYHQEEDVHLHERMIENQEQLRACYLDDILFVRNGNGFAWNKIYRRSLIEKYHLRFDTLRIQQDEVFNLKLYPMLERVSLSPIILYDYYIYSTGNNRSRFIPDRFDIYVKIREEFEKLRKTWNITDARYSDYLQKRFYYSFDDALRINMLHPDCPWSRKEKTNEIKKVMSHPYTQEAMVWAKQNLGGLENRMYLQAYQNKSLCLITLYSSFFSLLRKMKHKIAK